MATQTAKNASGADFSFELPLTPGRAGAAASRPVVLSTEDKTALDALATQTTAAAILAKLPAVGTAGSAATNVITVQGIASGTAQPVSLTTLPALATGANAIGSITNTSFISTGNVAHDAADSGNPIKVGGKAYASAPAAVGDGDRVDQAMTLRGGAHTVFVRADGTIVDPDAPASVFVQSSEYETVAASQTDQILGTTGAIGDKLEALLVTPTSTTVGAISIEDGSTNTVVYAGGTVGADLKPFIIPLFGIAATTSTGWEITTGAGATVIAFGQFT